MYMRMFLWLFSNEESLLTLGRHHPSELTANTRRWTNVVLMLGQRRRRWPNIKTTLAQGLVFAVVCRVDFSSWLYIVKHLVQARGYFRQGWP